MDCQLRRLTDRTIKGYYNNTLNFLIYAEKHHGITEIEEIYTLHIKHYEKVKDKDLLMALQEQYIIIDNHDTYKELSKDPTFTVLKNVFKRKKSKKT